MIVRRRGQFVLLAKSTGAVLGRHPTYEAALRQERAIQIHKHARANPGEVTALIVMHLSSLDTLQWMVPREAEALGERLAAAVNSHDGPVIIVDQAWRLKRGDSDTRVDFLQATAARKVKRIRFDEEKQEWPAFLTRIDTVLRKLGVTRVVVAGLWTTPDHSSGCASRLYTHLKRDFSVTLSAALSASEAGGARANPSGPLFPDYPARYTVEPLKTAEQLGDFLLEAVPVMVLTHMACAGSVKVCSGISPAFAAVAADRGFAAFVARKPGHVVNVVATRDQGLVEVDLSHIQFELPAYPEEEDVDRVLAKAMENPFAAVKITRLDHEPRLEPPPTEFDKFFDPLGGYARGVKTAQRIRDGGKLYTSSPAAEALYRRHMRAPDAGSLAGLRGRKNPRRGPATSTEGSLAARLAPYVGKPGYFVHFTAGVPTGAGTRVTMLSMNMHTKHEAPIGIYGYPMEKSVVATITRPDSMVPFVQSPVVIVFRLRGAPRLFELYSRAGDMDEDLAKLRTLVDGERFDRGVAKLKTQYVDKRLMFYPLVKRLARDLEGTSGRVEAGEVDPAKMTTLFKRLGYDGILDEDKRMTGEPQVIIFSSKHVEVVESFNNPNASREDRVASSARRNPRRA